MGRPLQVVRPCRHFVASTSLAVGVSLCEGESSCHNPNPALVGNCSQSLIRNHRSSNAWVPLGGRRDGVELKRRALQKSWRCRSDRFRKAVRYAEMGRPLQVVRPCRHFVASTSLAVGVSLCEGESSCHNPNPALVGNCSQSSIRNHCSSNAWVPLGGRRDGVELRRRAVRMFGPMIFYRDNKRF